MKQSKEYAIVCHPKNEQAVKKALSELNGEYDIIVKAHPYMQESMVVLMCRDMLTPIDPEDSEWFGKLLEQVKTYAPKLEPFAPPKAYCPQFYANAVVKVDEPWKGRVKDERRKKLRQMQAQEKGKNFDNGLFRRGLRTLGLRIRAKGGRKWKNSHS